MRHEEQAAKTIAGTLNWAARQASNPAYARYTERGQEIRFVDTLTGAIYSMTVRQVGVVDDPVEQGADLPFYNPNAR